MNLLAFNYFKEGISLADEFYKYKFQRQTLLVTYRECKREVMLKY